MENSDVILSGLCTGLFLVLFLALIAAAVYLRIRANSRWLKRYHAAKARGALNDINSPKMTVRFRLLAILALIGLLGSFSSLGLFGLKLYKGLSISPQVTIVSFAVFALLGSIAGLLMQREINRRL
jgi:hypothetical protein